MRGDFVESLHRGLGVITAPDGSVEFAVGDADTPVFPRSSLKPLQAVAAIRAGARLRDGGLAVVCSSHSGEAMHVAAVTGVLAEAGLGTEVLRNTPSLPINEAAMLAWVAAGRGKESIVQNCSGNHAGMLAACVAQGWELETYLDPAHPHQVLTEQVAEEYFEEQVTALAVDGCGAPVWALPLQGLARAYGRLAAAGEGTDREVADAMRAHPELVGGTGRDVTHLMQDAPGLICKDGAESVYACGLPDGRGLAVKIVDGGDRARRGLLAELLRRTGYCSEAALSRLADVEILGHGRPVGRVVPLPLG